MKGDFSRLTFNRAKSFTRVLMQQGRVQLDSDFNEQVEILWHYLRTLATDLIGPHGGPAGEMLGFAVTPKAAQNRKDLEDLIIGYGRYYVDGILCENLPGGMMMEDAHSAKPGHAAEHEMSEDEGTNGQDDEDEGAMARTPGTPGFPGGPILPGMPHSPDTGVSYYGQRGAILSAEEARARYDEIPKEQHPFLLYLDVWERSVSGIEEPGIVEVALGGPDTAARTQVVWQVRAEELKNVKADEIHCDEFEGSATWTNLLNKLQPKERGRLAAKAREPRTEESTDPCIISPDALYRGAENQLYRVEIHTGGTTNSVPRATFKWSRDNGSNVYPVLTVKDKMVFLEHLGRDSRSGLQAGDWVEIVTDEYTPLRRAQPLSQVESVDPIGMTVTLKTAPPANALGKYPMLRRWDQRTGDQNVGGLELNDDDDDKDRDNAAFIKAQWLNLEDGIQVRFEAGRTYVAGDYWLIPARTATGDIQWPRGDNPMLPPQGITHHYAPLAGVFFGAHGPAAEEEYFVTDLRRRINPIAACLHLIK
jgi:hypothetical protein